MNTEYIEALAEVDLTFCVYKTSTFLHSFLASNYKILQIEHFILTYYSQQVVHSTSARPFTAMMRIV